MKILLVEDDAVLGNGLSQTLKNSGFDVTLAVTGTYADGALRTYPYDLVILDLGLPDIDGLNVLKKMRLRKSAIPVLVLTARDAINDRVRGLELGADDYMTKPFDSSELIARIRALLRRSLGGFNHNITVGRLVLDTLNQQITIDNVPVLLPLREYSVLEALMLQVGRVVSKDKIAQRIAVDTEELADNAIEVYIHRLRKRFEMLGVCIRTVRGLGYLLERNDLV